MTTPTILWVKVCCTIVLSSVVITPHVQALDLLLGQMQESCFPFSRVLAVSGSAQQHGSVYWRKGAGLALAQLHTTQTLAEQLQVSQYYCMRHSVTLCPLPAGMVLCLSISCVDGL